MVTRRVMIFYRDFNAETQGFGSRDILHGSRPEAFDPAGALSWSVSATPPNASGLAARTRCGRLARLGRSDELAKAVDFTRALEETIKWPNECAATLLEEGR